MGINQGDPIGHSVLHPWSLKLSVYCYYSWDYCYYSWDYLLLECPRRSPGYQAEGADLRHGARFNGSDPRADYRYESRGDGHTERALEDSPGLTSFWINL